MNKRFICFLLTAFFLISMSGCVSIEEKVEEPIIEEEVEVTEEAEEVIAEEAEKVIEKEAEEVVQQPMK